MDEIQRQAATLLQVIRDIERALGDDTRLAFFQNQHGKQEGTARYQAWRHRAHYTLGQRLAEYRNLKQQILNHEILVLLQEVWVSMRDYPELRTVRDRVRFLLRDRFRIYVKDD